MNVTSPNPAGVYAPGDVVTVWVAFDRHVVVVGEPVLHLHTGKTEPGRATYAEGSGNQVGVQARVSCFCVPKRLAMLGSCRQGITEIRHCFQSAESLVCGFFLSPISFHASHLKLIQEST